MDLLKLNQSRNINNGSGCSRGTDRGLVDPLGGHGVGWFGGCLTTCFADMRYAIVGRMCLLLLQNTIYMTIVLIIDDFLYELFFLFQAIYFFSSFICIIYSLILILKYFA